MLCVRPASPMVRLALLGVREVVCLPPGEPARDIPHEAGEGNHVGRNTRDETVLPRLSGAGEERATLVRVRVVGRDRGVRGVVGRAGAREGRPMS